MNERTASRNFASLLWEIRDLKLRDLAHGLNPDELTSLTRKLERAARLAKDLPPGEARQMASVVFPPSDLNLEDLKGAGLL
jgi:hypothetical protein